MMSAPGILSYSYRQRAPIERLVAHLHRLGPRALAEFLDALSVAHGIGPAIVRQLEQYHRLDRLTLAALRGDRFAPAPTRRVGGA